VPIFLENVVKQVSVPIKFPLRAMADAGVHRKRTDMTVVFMPSMVGISPLEFRTDRG
jgi:hypothetical protein